MIYIIKFSGIWPVGACAIAVAETPERAEANFRQLWKDTYSSAKDPDPIEIQEFELHDGLVRIILNGDY